MSQGADGTSELTVDTAASLLAGLDLEPEETQDAPAAADPAKGEAPDESPDEEPEAEETPADDAEPDAPEADEPEATDPDDEPTEPEDEPAPQPRTFKVKVDGEELEVPEDELLRGYSRQADYTRKTQQLAEQRKQFEDTEVAAVRAERAQYETYLLQLKQVLDQAQGTQEPDWNKLRQEMSPAEYAAAVSDFMLQQEQRKKIDAELETVQRKRAEDESAQLRAYVETEQRKLVEALPEWTKPEVKAKELQALRTYAQGLGFGTDDLANVRDHRIVLMLRKAMLFDQAQEKARQAAPTPKAPASKPAPAAPAQKPAPVLKPGAAGAPAAKKANRTAELKRSLRASGSDKDAAALIETMLGDE